MEEKEWKKKEIYEDVRRRDEDFFKLTFFFILRRTEVEAGKVAGKEINHKHRCETRQWKLKQERMRDGGNLLGQPLDLKVPRCQILIPVGDFEG